MPISTRVQKVKEAFRVAFAVRPASEPCSAAEDALLKKVAAAVVARGLASPAILFLESAEPMNFLGSQALYFLSPILSCVCETREVEVAARLLERRAAVARLIALIEAQATAAASDPAKAPAR